MSVQTAAVKENLAPVTPPILKFSFHSKEPEAIRSHGEYSASADAGDGQPTRDDPPA